MSSDKLTDYSEFVNDAIRNYDVLPQETGELYKRYFINIPFDLKAAAMADSSDSEVTDANKLKSEILDGFSKLNLKFDASLGSFGYDAAANRYVKMTSPEQSPEFLDGSMYGNNEDKYVAYVRAYSNSCALVDVPDGKSANINMLMLNSSRPLNTSVFVKVGNNAKVNIFEHYCSAASSISSLGAIHEIRVGNGSEVEINALHNENSNTICLAFSKNRIGTDSHLKLNSVYSGAAHTRVRNVIEATERGSRVSVNEVIFGSLEQKFDIGTYIINKGAHSNASLESKAALMDSSFCIMKGFAKITRGAAKSKSYVHERGILLDKGARVYGLPDMSVDENDVKATHSSATSPVDPESVFYLMSKGIDGSGVRKLLVTGFFADSVAKVQNSFMKELSMSLINSKLETGKYGSMPNIDARNMWISTGSEHADMFKGHYKYRGE